MRQPKKPGFKKWLMVAAAALGIGGAMSSGTLPDLNTTTGNADQNTLAMTETIPANSPDIIWITIQPSISTDFNNITAKGQQDMLNFNLQSAASLGNANTVENLLNQGASAKADDSAALKLAMTGSKSATNTADQQSFDKIIQMLSERGATASDQQSLTDKTTGLLGQSAPTPDNAPPTVK